MSAKLRVSVCRKIGRPNYSSIGGDVSLEIDIDRVTADDPVRLRAAVVDISETLRAALAAELTRLAGEPDPGDEAEAQEPNGRHQDPPGPRTEVRDVDDAPARPDRSQARRPAAGRGDSSKPTKGPALWAWLKEQEETNGDAEGLVAHVMDWAKEEKIAGSGHDRGPGVVTRALDEALAWLGQ